MPQGLIMYFGSMVDGEYWQTLHEAGLELGIVYDRSGFYKAVVPPEFSRIVEADLLTEVDTVVDHLRSLRDAGRLGAVVNIDELRIRQWADVCAELGIPAISPRTARLVRSKVEMRRAFDQALPAGANARWAIATSVSDVQRFVRDVGGPVVIKPDGLWGSFFVAVCQDQDDAVAAYESLQRDLPGYYATKLISEPPTILIEEFIAGSNHSVECVAGPDGIVATPVVDVLTGADVGGADMHHFARVLPSALGPAAQESVQQLAVDAVAALGMDIGVAHVEIILSPTGPRLVEIAARPGANRPFLLREAMGIDIMKAYVSVLQGRTPELARRRTGAAAVVTPFPRTRGTLRSLPGLSQVEALPSVREVLVRAKPGSDVSLRRDGSGAAPLRLIMESDDPDRLRADLAEVVRLSAALFDVVPHAVAPQPVTGD